MLQYWGYNTLTTIFLLLMAGTLKIQVKIFIAPLRNGIY